MSDFSYHSNWHFANSENGLNVYTLTDAGFQEEQSTACLRPSHQSKFCILHTKQSTWNQIGVREVFMNALRSDWNISLEFWRQVWHENLAGFQRHHTLDHESASRNRLNSIDVGFCWVAGLAGFMKVFAHHDIERSQTLLFVLEGLDLGGEALLELLQAHVRLSRQPLETIGLLLMTSFKFMVNDVQKCGVHISTMELSLEVSVDTRRLQMIGYSKSQRSLPDQNKFLYSLQKRIAANARSYRFIISICDEYLVFAACLNDRHMFQIPTQDADEVVRRLSMDTSYISYLDKMVQTQFMVLQNMILREDAKVSIAIAATSKTIAEATRNDSSAMKTIAYLTLAFLPTAIVSSIFSTTVLNFQNWSPSNNGPRVVSSGWWVYALTCGLTTAVTLLIYFIWPMKWNSTSRRQVLDKG